MSSKKICCCCLQEVEQNLICSGCRTARYCGIACQSKHWPIHKQMCIDSNCEYNAQKISMKALNFQNQGNYPKAEKLYRKALGIVRQDRGENDPLTLDSTENVAEVCSRQQKHEEAIALYEECLLKRQSLFGRNDPETIKTLSFLASSYAEQGGEQRYVKAAELYRECLAFQMSALGENIDTLETMGALAFVLSKQQEKIVEAVALFEECFNKQTLVLGANHLSTLRTLENLGNHHYEQNDIGAATREFKQLYDSEKLVLGENHPYTLRAMQLLAHAYIKDPNLTPAKLNEATELLRQCLARQKSVLGNSHPDTLDTESVLAHVLYAING